MAFKRTIRTLVTASLIVLGLYSLFQRIIFADESSTLQIEVKRIREKHLHILNVVVNDSKIYEEIKALKSSNVLDINADVNTKVPASGYISSQINAQEFLRSELGDNVSIDSVFPCRHTNISALSFPICLYKTEDDIWVSKAFHSNSYWEADSVERLIKFVQRYSPKKDIGFIDIGANIGTYTLPLAHLGLPVIAIEPNRATLTRLTASVVKGGISERVKLFRTGISDKRETFHLGYNPLNRGDTSLKNCTKGYGYCLNDSVSTLVLDDLSELVPHHRAVMKIDIQCAELRALNPNTSLAFFQRNDIPLILMEWECYTLDNRGSDATLDSRIDGLISFLTFMNYQPHSVENGTRMSLQEWKNYRSADVILIKTYNKTDQVYAW